MRLLCLCVNLVIKAKLITHRFIYQSFVEEYLGNKCSFVVEI